MGTIIRNGIIYGGDKARKYLIIGDSMTAHEVNWVTYWAQSMGITSNDYYKYGHGGWGFATMIGDPEIVTGNYQMLLEQAIAEIADPQNITDILIAGTQNDFAYGEVDLENCISLFTNTAKAHFKNAKLKLGLFSWLNRIEDIGGRTGRLAYFYKKLCVKYDIEYLHGCEYIMHDYRFFAPDGIHPKDAEVYKWVGQCIAQATKTGKVSINYVNYERQFVATNGFTVASGQTFTWSEYIYDGLSSVNLNMDLRLISDEGVSIKNETDVILFSLDEGLVKGAQNRYCTTVIPSTVMAKLKHNNAVYQIHGYIALSNNNIIFHASDKELPSITGDFVATGITIPKFSMTAPTSYC